MWALGLTGTYLGDYFGILMDAPVTGFPFNVTGAPMYVGSTLSFLGSAILFGKPAGLLLTAEVWTIYSIALRFEEWVSSFNFIQAQSIYLPVGLLYRTLAFLEFRIPANQSFFLEICSPFTEEIYKKRDEEARKKS